MSYATLHAHSQYSLLDGLSKAPAMAARVRQLGQRACALTDHGTVSGVVSFLKAMKGACKTCGYQPNQHADGGKGRCTLPGVSCPAYEPDPLKPILGCEFYLCQKDAKERNKDNNERSHLCVLAKNIDGWRNLIQASSASNRPEHFCFKPRLDLDLLASFAKGQWVVFSGHMGSDLANIVFADPKLAYSAKSYEEAKALAKPWPDLKRDVLALASRYRDLFGKENFFIEIQLIDAVNLPAAIVVAKVLRWAAKQLGIPCVATPDAHYPSMQDAGDQRVLLCSALDTTLKEADRRHAAGEEVGLGGFFKSNRYHLPSTQEMVDLHEEEELASTLRIAEMCEAYDITSGARLPKFDCPGGKTSDEYLRVLCEQGWGRKVAGRVESSKHAEYRARLDRELGVLTEAGLSPYFLIVDDYYRYYREDLGGKASKGRGSGAGSLVLHLLGVTDCDPIKYDLLFERFYNAGRNAPGRVSLPDVDCDFAIHLRDKVITYIRTKYGIDRVAQMATFGRYQGREALTAVFRAHEFGTFDERKAITAHIPDEAEIADKLQEMREEEGEASIIRWALENNGDALKEYCTLQEDGSLDGPLAPYFAQAIRIEGTKKSQGKHAAGVLISPEPLASLYPMLYDRSTGLTVVGYEMSDVEASGGVKFDILGVAGLSKVMGAVNTIRCGKVGAA